MGGFGARMKVFGYGQKLQIVVNTEREFRAKTKAP